MKPMAAHVLHVNGADRPVEADPQATLLSVLRDALGLSGPRFGCGEGECGACRVLVDGACVTSCDTPLWAVERKAITTLEGLGDERTPHPLQSAFLAGQAMQCGYCVSGIIMTAAALLSSNPDPTEDEVRQALARNLCRCGAHNRMVRAILTAAGEMRP